MAKFTKGHRFSVGKGRPKISPELHLVKEISREDVRLRISKFLGMTREEVKRVLEDPTSSSHDLLIATIVAKAVTHGDQNRLEFIYNRIVGRVKEEVEVNLPKPTVVVLSNEKKLIAGVPDEEGED